MKNRKYLLPGRAVEGGPGGPWPPQYFALSRLESSGKVHNTTVPSSLDFEVKILDKISRQILEVRQSRFSRFYSSDNRDRNGIIICTIP